MDIITDSMNPRPKSTMGSRVIKNVLVCRRSGPECRQFGQFRPSGIVSSAVWCSMYHLTQDLNFPSTVADNTCSACSIFCVIHTLALTKRFWRASGHLGTSSAHSKSTCTLWDSRLLKRSKMKHLVQCWKCPCKHAAADCWDFCGRQAWILTLERTGQQPVAQSKTQ